MRNAIESFRVGSYLVEIFQDEDAEAPDSWGNEDIFLVADCGRYFSTGKGDAVDYVDTYEIFPVHAYIHSGVVLSIAPFGCVFDSGVAGFVAVKRDAGFTNPEEAAKSLIDEWNTYLSGDVYGYRISKVKTCDLGHEHTEEVDSCWGFYGIESVRDEARASANAANMPAGE